MNAEDPSLSSLPTLTADLSLTDLRALSGETTQHGPPHLASPAELHGLQAGELLACGLHTPVPTGGIGTWEPPEPERLSEMLPQYRIEYLIGHGGMGAVYKGVQRELGRPVAIKILPAEVAADGQFIARFQREARTLARLKHPGIVAIYGFGEISDDHLHIVMEFVDGTDLSQIIRSAPLSSDQALELTMQICDALHYAHSQGVIHRDIKPANILVGKDGRAKLADFGLARPEIEDQGMLTVSGVVMGTPAYMAPEQRQGHADHRTDIYALGMVLYEMLTGKRPQGVFDPPSVKVPVDRRFDEVVIKAMQQAPQHRYQNVTELKTDLDRIRTMPLSGTRRSMVLRVAPQKPARRAVKPARRFVRALEESHLIAIVFWWLALAVGGYCGWVLMHQEPPASWLPVPKFPPPVTSRSTSPSSTVPEAGREHVVTGNVVSGTGTLFGGASPVGLKISETALRTDGAFGFRQQQAKVFCDDDDLRLSVWNNNLYLYVQAVFWKDNDPASGKTDDGRDIGDNSSLMIDVDADGKVTPDVDRVYLLDPWPSMPGLHYQVCVREGAWTFIQNDTSGHGAIRYVQTPEGRKIRVDLYLIPLADLSKRVTDKIRLCYWGSSPVPKLTVNSAGYTSGGISYYSYNIPYASYHDYILTAGSEGQLSPESIPDGRNTASAPAPRNRQPMPMVGAVPPEIAAKDWLNVNSGPALASLRGQVVLVEFWATWCGPCVKGIPHLNELQSKYAGKGFRILSFTEQNRQGTENFTKGTPMAYTIGLESESTFDRYGITAIPQAFLVDKSGRISWEGNSNDPTMEDAVEKALGTAHEAMWTAMDLKFTAVDGREVDLAKLRGKVVLIDFWATWCGPCLGELPHVVEAYQKFHDKGFEIIGISFDQEKAALERVTKDHEMTWPQYFDGKGWENAFGAKYGIHSIPTMWLVNKQGVIVSRDARKDLTGQIEKLLAEPSVTAEKAAVRQPEAPSGTAQETP